MGCFIFVSIQMLPKRDMSAGKQVLHPMPERFSAALGFLYVRQGLGKGWQGIFVSRIYFQLSCQAGRFWNKFCLLSRDYRDFHEQAPIPPPCHLQQHAGNPLNCQKIVLPV